MCLSDWKVSITVLPAVCLKGINCIRRWRFQTLRCMSARGKLCSCSFHPFSCLLQTKMFQIRRKLRRSRGLRSRPLWTFCSATLYQNESKWHLSCRWRQETTVQVGNDEHRVFIFISRLYVSPEFYLFMAKANIYSKIIWIIIWSV